MSKTKDLLYYNTYLRDNYFVVEGNDQDGGPIEYRFSEPYTLEGRKSQVDIIWPKSKEYAKTEGEMYKAQYSIDTIRDRVKCGHWELQDTVELSHRLILI